MAMDPLGIILAVVCSVALLCAVIYRILARAKVEEEQRVDEELGRQVECRIAQCPPVRLVSDPEPVNKCPHCLHCYPTTASSESSNQPHPAISEVDHSLPSYTDIQGPLLHPRTNISNTHNSLQLVPMNDSSTSARSYPMLQPGLSPAPPVPWPFSTPAISPAPQL